MAFQKATKKAARARVAFIGPSGAGKTFTALRVARGLVGPEGKIALADSERGSASKYAGLFDFDTQDLETFSPKDYIRVIHEAEAAGYDALIIDSLSHAWMGKGGALEMVDAAAKASKSRNSFDAWRSVTPEHNAMVDAIVRARLHIIVTMRVKTEYVVEEVNGKKTPRKVGLAPVQRDGLEYEFDVVADMDGAEAVVTKTRCSALAKAVIQEPGEALGKQLRDWLTDGAPEAPPNSATGEQVRSTVVAFGPYKGKTCAELSDDQLSETIDLANEKLAEQPDAKWAAAMRTNLGALESEAVFRARVPSSPATQQ
jgi:DNA polymerase III delta prime subunit